MYSCWNIDSKLRPTFDVLENNIVNLMNRDIANHYIELNDPYSKENLDNLDTDFLAKMADPSYEIPLTPKCSNIKKY